MNPPPLPTAFSGDSAQERRGILLSRLLDSGQWERALAVAGEWLAEEPEATAAHRAAAQALVNLRRYRLASPHLHQVLGADPNDGFACRLASIANFHQGRYDRAEKEIQRAIRLQPEDASHWYHLAVMRYQHSARPVALKYARRALELAPTNAEVINLVALCEGNDPGKQFSRYLEALKTDPGNATVHYNVGLHFLHFARDHRQAAVAFRNVLALDPANRSAQEHLLLALRDGDPVYQALQRPDRLFEGYGNTLNGEGSSGAVAMALVMSRLAPFVMMLYVPWLLFGWPLQRVYDLMLRRDVRAQAGMIGAGGAGWLHFWRWPRRWRVGLLLVAYGVCWLGAAVLILRVVFRLMFR